MENADTIFALASARGRAGVAIIRVSGPQAFLAVVELAKQLPEPRKTSLRLLWDGDEALDQALVIIFEKGASFTGEDVAEFHVHGGIAVVKSVLSALGRVEGLRSAQPGEFTRRALENDRMDLPQVEGLADLIDAETEAQRRQALMVMQGSLSQKCEQWRQHLVRAMALLEAVIDFVDEDVPVDVAPEVKELLREVLGGIESEISGSRAAEKIRDGFEVALVGPPNIGKSTLLNAIAGREVALTSEIAGTTRDVLEVSLNLDGLPVTILDLAGIRESNDTIEKMGIERAVKRANGADLRVFMVEENDNCSGDGIIWQKGDIVAIGKGDQSNVESLKVSGKTGLGVSRLLAGIAQELEGRAAGSSLLIRQRHKEAAENAIKYIKSTLLGLEDENTPYEIISADLAFAVSSLDELIGRVDVEQILGEIFAGFCIGK
ncbi:MAG: tRNA uridine-5-carboxymethylaminomethyl(34) synthesis GTPase MnmE [Rhodobacteraceae bacterium]|nr:tRNA uridine-5-carboxymethylaminomethyl(34) synthesis GTPase MnmE [Paracoccaceae bacterium]